MGLQMDAVALNAFLAEEFSQMALGFSILEVNEEGLIARLCVDERHLRPGGTVSGPTMFGLADLAIYCVVLSRVGCVPLAVTTNASIDFMRKPEAGRDMRAECRMLKLGRKLAIADALIFSEGQSEPVARCSMTYAIPPQVSRDQDLSLGK
ncbi:MAG: PaaI family thioesterase [Paracoccus sp. (in: a-proteobacteria)]